MFAPCLLRVCSTSALLLRYRCPIAAPLLIYSCSIYVRRYLDGPGPRKTPPESPSKKSRAPISHYLDSLPYNVSSQKETASACDVYTVDAPALDRSSLTDCLTSTEVSAVICRRCRKKSQEQGQGQGTANLPRQLQRHISRHKFGLLR